ncbi:unnamed protein product [Amoebophrya sp. A120]|nr:unnamed protein product [Amoebophrya sp. A120]|eukprot:GSA120T00022293001.1
MRMTATTPAAPVAARKTSGAPTPSRPPPVSTTRKTTGVPPTLFTLGHSTRSVSELVELLKANDIGYLIDIRASPFSRKNPHFDKTSELLQQELNRNQIQYEHCPELGGAPAGSEPGRGIFWNLRQERGQRKLQEIVDRVIKNNCVEDYDTKEGVRVAPPAGSTSTSSTTAAGTTIAHPTSSGSKNTAIMCACFVWNECHRQVISQRLAERNVTVKHLTEVGKQPIPHPTRMLFERALVESQGGLDPDDYREQMICFPVVDFNSSFGSQINGMLSGNFLLPQEVDEEPVGTKKKTRWKKT